MHHSGDEPIAVRLVILQCPFRMDDGLVEAATHLEAVYLHRVPRGRVAWLLVNTILGISCPSASSTLSRLALKALGSWK